MSERPEPPVTKYRYTLTLTGNSHDEIEHELLVMTRGGYLLDSDHYQRDSFSVVGGRKNSVLVCTNPEQTPEAYDAALSEWWEARKVARLASPAAADDAGRP